jgi:hypothetical protein
MFNFFKGKTTPPDPLSDVTAHLKNLAYDLTPYGASVASLELQSGYSPAEVASHLALITMALDIKNVGLSTQLLWFVPHARALLDVLKSYRDKGLMREAIWKNDATAVYGISMVDNKQVQWIDKVLSDPIAGKERLANSRINYEERYGGQLAD